MKDVNIFKYLFIILVSFIAGWMIKGCQHSDVQNAPTFIQHETKENRTPSESQQTRHSEQNSIAESSDGSIPNYVIETLNYVKAHGEAPEGYVGGRKFQNRERILPQKDNQGNKLSYQEWDVHPKMEGQNRGAERMITSSDGRAYFTEDHYRTFTEIK